MYEINQRVSWSFQGATLEGRVVDTEVTTSGTVFMLCEDGSHPRNGVYARRAEDIQAI